MRKLTTSTVNLNAKLRSKDSVIRSAELLGYSCIRMELSGFDKTFTSVSGKKYVCRISAEFAGERISALFIRSRGMSNPKKTICHKVTKEQWESVKDEHGFTRFDKIRELFPEIKGVVNSGVQNGNTFIFIEQTDETYEYHDTEYGDYTKIDIDQYWWKAWNVIRVDYAKRVAKEQQLDTTCPKCGGSGFLPEFAHVAEGVCFMCIGSGHVINNTIVNVTVEK